MANENIVRANAEVLDLLLTCPIVDANEKEGFLQFSVNDRLVLASVNYRSNIARQLMFNQLEKMGLSRANKLTPQALETKLENFSKLENLYWCCWGSKIE